MATSLIATSNGTINIKGEHDWFRVTLDANTLYEISIPNLPNQVTVDINLYGAGGTPLDLVYTSYAGAAAFMGTSSGTYYIDIGSNYPTTFFTDYTVNLSTSTDDFWNNASTVGSVAVGGSTTGNIDIAGDEDWIRVDLTANTLYAITASGLQSASLGIVDSTGATVEAADAQGGSTLGFMPATGGTYYIDVSSVTAGNYTINVASVSDDYRNNTTTIGTVIVGASSSGIINVAGDHDWFAVELSANTLYALSATGLDAADSGMLGVYDANGNAADAFWATSSGTQGFMTDTSGTYYIEVSSSTPASYTLSVATSPDDYRNNTSTLGIITDGGSVNGTLELPRDHDWFKVTNLTPNTLYEITTSGLYEEVTAEVQDPQHPGQTITVTVPYPTGFLQIRDSSGHSIQALDTYGTTGIGFMPKTSGDYYIDVSNRNQTGQKNYTLSVASSTDDYSNNDTNTGTIVNGTASGVINVVGDHDWFAVDLQADTLYEITTTGLDISGTLSPFIVMYDNDGLLVQPVSMLVSGVQGFLGFMPDSTNTYYIDVGSISSAGAYTLHVAVSPDDYENNIRTDGVLTAAAPSDTTAPTVSTFLPADEASDVALAANLVITFSEAIQRGSGDITLKTAAGATVATFDAATSTNLLIDGNTLTINPDADLDNDTEYQVEFAAGSLEDLAGNPYAGSTSYNFTTVAAPNEAPTLDTPTPIAYTDTAQADVFIETSGTLVGDDGNDDNLSYGIEEGVDQGDGTVTLAGIYGTLIVTKATGAYTFAPNGVAIEGLKSGTSEAFTVTVSDGTASASATLTVNLTAADDAPTLGQAVDDASATTGQAFTLTLPAGTIVDADDATLSYSAALANDDPLPNWLSFDSLTLTFSGTPGAQDAGQLTIRVSASDGSSSADDTFLLDVLAPADTTAPTVATFLPADEASDVALAANLVITFSEAIQRGSGDIVLKTAAGATVATFDAATSTNLLIDGNTLTINPDADLDNGTEYRVEFAAGSLTDLAGNPYAGSDSYDFTTIAAPNDAPTLETPPTIDYTDTAQADVFTETSGTLVGDDGDADSLTYGIADGIDQGNGTVSLAGIYGTLLLTTATGAYTFFPDDAAIEGLKSGTSESFTVTVSDGTASANATLTVNLTAANDAPTLDQAIDDTSAATGQAFTLTLPAGTFSDADDATLSYSAALANDDPLPNWLSFDPASRTFSGTAGAQDAGQLTIRVSASDGSSSADDTFLLDVQALADTTAPTVSTFLPADGASNVALTDNIVITFNEPIQRGTGDIILSFTAPDAIHSIEFDVATTVFLTIDGNTLTINLDFDLDHATEYRLELPAGSLTDLAGNPYAGSTSYNFTTVAAPNEAPTLDTPTPIAYTDTAQADVFIETSGTLVGDDGNDDNLSYGIEEGVDQGDGTVTLAGIYGTLIVTKATGAYTFAPNGVAIEGLKSGTSESFTVSVSDGTASASATLTVNLTAADDAPTLGQAIDDASATTGQSFTLTLPAGTIVDADDTDLSYSAALANDDPLPNWLSFDPLTLTFSGTPGAQDAGQLTIRVSASDGSSSADDTFLLAVQIPADTTAPTVATFLPADEASDVALAANLVITFSEAIQRGSGDITLKTAAGATVATFDAATSTNLLIDGNTLTINPDADLDYGTEYQVEFAAGSLEDLAGNPYAGSTSYNFTTVAAPNEAPTLDTPTPIAYTDTDQADVFVETAGTLVGDDGDADSLTYGIADGIDQGNGTVSLAGIYGTLLLTTATGAYTFFPDDAAIEGLKSGTSEAFTVTVSDGTASANATLTVNLTAANDAPTLDQAIDDASAATGQAFTLTLPAGTFGDADDATLSYSAALANDNPLPNWLSFDPASRTFSGTAGAQDAGQLDIRVSASDGSSSASDTFALTVTSVTTGQSGVVADGYIAGASLFIDVNGNGIADPAEATGATTDNAGNFSLQTSLVGPLIAVGGTNIDTGLPNTLQLSAPSGSTVINPLTTLVQNIATQQGIPAADAEALAQTALGITANVDLTQYDPLAAGTPEAVAIQQLAAQVAVVATLAPSGDTSFASMAAALISAGTQVVDLSSATVLQGIFPGETGDVIARIAQINQSLAETNSLTDISAVQETSLNNSNDAPMLLVPLVDDRTAIGQTLFSYSIPENSFIDLDAGDHLTYSASLADGSPLPAWLSFNPDTLTFSGVPDNTAASVLSIRVTATDTGNLFSSDLFSLTLGARQTGSAGQDSFTSSSGDDSFDGAAGLDQVLFQSRHAAYSVVRTSDTSVNVMDQTGNEGSDQLTGIERLTFADSHLAFDTDGNAGQMYRLYKAAFARTPDLLGLGNWIANLDSGAVSLEQAAATFAASQEFQNLYGSNTSNEAFVSLLYLNALGRKADDTGLQNYVNALAAGTLTRAKVLAEFSESVENKNSVQELTGNGILYATADQAANQGLSLPGNSGADNLYGSVGKDTLTGAGGDDFLNGGADIDTAIYSGARADYTITRTATGLTVTGGTEGTDTLVNVERLQFSDGTQAFDVEGNAGQVYRLYQAAFDRSPDIGGMSNYLRAMDNGMTLSRIATDLMGSTEFTNKYGASTSNDAFVTLLYENALDRAPDEAGKANWIRELELGMTRENALIGFAESVENQAAVIGVIDAGISIQVI